MSGKRTEDEHLVMAFRDLAVFPHPLDISVAIVVICTSEERVSQGEEKDKEDVHDKMSTSGLSRTSRW